MSEKGMIFEENSKIICVYHKRHKNKMITKLHAVFNVVFGSVFFVILIFNIHGRKERFTASSQISIPEKPIFGHFEVIFLNV